MQETRESQRDANGDDELSLLFGSDEREAYITFSVASENYGIHISRVSEFVRYSRNTRLPHTPDCLAGVINLRGEIVPLLDFRIKFQLDRKDHDRWSSIVVTNVDDKLVGIIVDQLGDILNLTEDEIRPAPDATQSDNGRFILGMTGSSDQMTILLDVDELLSEDELVVVRSLHE